MDPRDGRRNREFSRRKLLQFSGTAFGLSAMRITWASHAVPNVFAEIASSRRAATDWLHAAQWGCFNQGQMAECQHPPITTVAAWNAAVDAYDTEAVANQLQRLGASYLIHCLGQNSGFYCAPNATYDRLVGYEPSHLATRDLVADLYESLHPRGIGLMVYLPSGAPANDPKACAALQWRNGNYRLANFQAMWQDIMAEWSRRWGKKVQGWWFDGCVYGEAMYNFREPPNWDSFAAAARAGNSASLVAFNPGPQNPIQALAPQEDYTAGEENSGLGLFVRSRWSTAPADATEDTNPVVMTQCLTFAGRWWAEGDQPKYTTPELISATNSLVSAGAAITWDMPVENQSGLIQPAFEAPFTMVADQLLGRSTVPSASKAITYSGGQWTRSSDRGPATDESVHLATANGAFAELSFNGSGVQILSQRGPDLGKLQLLLDGRPVQTCDCFVAGERRTQQVIYEVKGLTAGSHKVRLMKVGGACAVVEAFRILSSLRSVVNDDDSAIHYAGKSWSAEAGTSVADLRQDVHSTTHVGDYFTYTFVGTGIQYVTEVGPNMGEVEVFLDAVSHGTHSCHGSDRTITQQPVFSALGLPYGSHTIKVQMVSGAYCRLDYLRVYA